MAELPKQQLWWLSGGWRQLENKPLQSPIILDSSLKTGTIITFSFQRWIRSLRRVQSDPFWVFNWELPKETYSNVVFREQISHFGWKLSTLCSAWLTLTRGLEAEGLEATGEGGGVDDINAVLALAPSIQGDSDDEKHDRHHARGQSWVQGHVAAALHTLKRERETRTHRFVRYFPGSAEWTPNWGAGRHFLLHLTETLRH